MRRLLPVLCLIWAGWLTLAVACKRTRPAAAPEPAKTPQNAVMYVARHTLPSEKFVDQVACTHHCAPQRCYSVGAGWVCVRRCASHEDCPPGMYCYCSGGGPACDQGMRGGVHSICLAGPRFPIAATPPPPAVVSPADGGWQPGQSVLDRLRRADSTVSQPKPTR